MILAAHRSHTKKSTTSFAFPNHWSLYSVQMKCTRPKMTTVKYSGSSRHVLRTLRPRAAILRTTAMPMALSIRFMGPIRAAGTVLRGGKKKKKNSLSSTAGLSNIRSLYYIARATREDAVRWTIYAVYTGEFDVANRKDSVRRETSFRRVFVITYEYNASSRAMEAWNNHEAAYNSDNITGHEAAYTITATLDRP
jgi:hypothetical protein